MSERRDVIILGAGRSGTSMVAGCLATSGWWPGDDLYPARATNPKGFFENAEINGINEHLLGSALGASAGVGPRQRWLAHVTGPLRFDVPSRIAARIATLMDQGPVCFKDPRFSHTLPAWRPWLEDAAFVCVFRDPAEVAASVVKECSDMEYLQDLPMDLRRSEESWVDTYRPILEEHRHDGRWLFLRYDQLFTDEGLDRLEAHVGAPIDRSFPERRLHRSSARHTVGSAASAVYAELCSLAGARVPEPTAVPSPPQAAPVLSVVLCTFNRRERLMRCLDRLAAQTVVPGTFEVVLVDDGCTDGTVEAVAERADPFLTHVLSQPNRGLAAARNAGIAIARGQLLLLLDDDVMAAPDLIQRHLEAHQAATGPTSVLGTMELPPESAGSLWQQFLAASYYVFPYSLMTPGERYGWTHFWTGNVSMPAALVRAVGGFDEGFAGYGCEDTDLGRRLELAGCPVLYHPAARALHDHALTLDDLAARTRVVGVAFVRFFDKHPDAISHPNWAWMRDFTSTSCRQHVIERLADLPGWEHTARAVGGVDLTSNRNLGVGVDLVQHLVPVLAPVVDALYHVWWREGLVDGFRELGVDGFPHLLQRAAARRAAAQPWPLDTAAGRRVVAWPDYDEPADLVALGSWLAEHGSDPDLCLCLRHDPDLDIDLDAAIERAVHVVGSVDALVVAEPMAVDEWCRLGAAATAVLALPSATRDQRRGQFVDEVGRGLLV